MRVMHVMESTIGGTRRHLVDLAGGLAERGVEVHLVVAAERQPDFREDLKRLVRDFLEIAEEQTGRPFPVDPMEQLWGAILEVRGSIFESRRRPWSSLDRVWL